MRHSPLPGSNDEPVLAKQTILMALLLTAIVIGGFFLVTISMKFNGYPSNDVNWRAVPVFIRHHGFHLLWIPVAWTIVAVAAQRRDRGQLYSGIFWSGAALAIILFTTFFVAAYDPFTRPFILRIGNPAAEATATTQ